MEILKSLLQVAILFTVLGIQSCSDKCENVVCQNGGSCDKGICVDCNTGFVGDDCGTIDVSLGLQALLEAGIDPMLLLNYFAAEEFYGKTYQGGLIFYLNTTNGTGMLAATEDQSVEGGWGCFVFDSDISNDVGDCPGMGNCEQPLLEETAQTARIGDGESNTISILVGCTDQTAAKVCRDYRGGAYEDWFLPSRGELNLMYINLKANELGAFTDNFYWCSTERSWNIAWQQNFIDGSLVLEVKSSYGHIRAVRKF